MKHQENLSPSEAGAKLGSISTPKKAASSARNGVSTQFQVKPLTDYPCECGKCPSEDSPTARPGKTTCPRGRIIWHRRRKEAKRREVI